MSETMIDEQFSCDCKDGETRQVSEQRVEHKCGFRPSASYGTLGIWTPYKRITNIAGRYMWLVDWPISDAEIERDVARGLWVKPTADGVYAQEDAL